ncbi:MAG: hypothetical protein ACP5G8_07725 [Athalassotoga sp.]
MISTLFDIHTSSQQVFTFVMLSHVNELLVLSEFVFSKDKKKGFNAFKFNSLELKGGETYVLEYIVDGKLIAQKMIRFEDGTYDFSTKIL